MEPLVKWEQSFRTLIQKNDGKPMAELLRNVLPSREKGMPEIPLYVIYQLAELFDPLGEFNRFGKLGKRQNAVRLKVGTLPKRQLNVLSRNQEIWARMTKAINSDNLSVEQAAARVSAEVRLSERQVEAIWAKGRRSQPMLAAIPNKRKRGA
jgi:hypothetical protein